MELVPIQRPSQDAPYFQHPHTNSLHQNFFLLTHPKVTDSQNIVVNDRTSEYLRSPERPWQSNSCRAASERAGLVSLAYRVTRYSIAVSMLECAAP